MAWDVTKRKNGITRRAWRIQVHVLHATDVEKVQDWMRQQKRKGGWVNPASHLTLEGFASPIPACWDHTFLISSKNEDAAAAWGRLTLQDWSERCLEAWPEAIVLFTAFSCTQGHSHPSTEASACWITHPGHHPARVDQGVSERGLVQLGLLHAHLNQPYTPSDLGLEFARKPLLHMESVQALLRSQQLEALWEKSVSSLPSDRKPRM